MEITFVIFHTKRISPEDSLHSEQSKVRICALESVCAHALCANALCANALRAHALSTLLPTYMNIIHIKCDI